MVFAANIPEKPHTTRWGLWAGVGLQLYGLYKIAVELLDWRGRLDAAIAAYHDLGEFRPVIEFLANPPVWLPVAVSITGLSLIYWDSARKKIDQKAHAIMIYGPLLFMLGGPIIGGVWLYYATRYANTKSTAADVSLTQNEQLEKAKRTAEAVKQLREEYMHTPGAYVLIDGEFPPDDWMNKKLKEMGIDSGFGGGITTNNRARNPPSDIRTEIQRLSNENLRSSVFALSSNLRTFANNFMAGFTNITTDPNVADKTAALRKMDASGRTEYQNTYVGLLREYKTEIETRLKKIGKFPPYKTPSMADDMGAPAIDSGFFQPLSAVAAANYIEYIARQLPPD